MSTVRFSPQKRMVAPRVDGGKVTVGECPVAPRRLPLSKTQVIVPTIMGAAFVGMIALVLTQPGLRSGPMGFFALFLPVMMLSSFAAVFMQGRWTGGDNKVLSPAALEEERRSYMVELDGKRDEIQEDARRQFEYYRFLHPEPGLLRGLVGSARMWERSSQEEGLVLHFGFVRCGTGTSDLVKKLEPPPLGEPADHEPVCYEALGRFTLEQTTVAGVAKPLSLRATPLMTLVGEDGPEAVYGLVRSMICQAVCFHSPRDLKVMVVTDDPEQWDWLKWLPHCQHDKLLDSGGSARLVWTSPQQMDAAVGRELHDVRENFGRATDTRPHWLVINDQARLDSEWDVITRKGSGGVAGVTFVRVGVREGGTDGK